MPARPHRHATLLATVMTFCAATAAAGPPSANTSTVASCIRVCPAGDMPIHVTVRDDQSMPVAGAVVTVDFCPRPGVIFCPLLGGEAYTIDSPCRVSMNSDGAGVANLPLRAGGVSLVDPITVSASGIPLAIRANVVSPDQDGDGVVAAPDLAVLTAKINSGGYDPTADFDCNGMLNGVDVDALTAHLGHQCSGGSVIEAPQLQVRIVGPSPMRGNHLTGFDLVIENRSNVTALGVPLWVAGVPADATVALDFPLGYPPREPGEPDWATVPLTFTSSGGRYLPLVIPRVPPGTVTRRIRFTVPAANSSFQLRAAVAPPWSGGGTLGACLAAAGVIADPACMGTALDEFAAFLSLSPDLMAVSAIGLWAKIAWGCEGAATLGAAITKAEQVLDVMVEPVDQTTTIGACEMALLPRWRDVLGIPVVTAIDPNDKLGVHGPVSGQVTLPYQIRFENLANATAPAQEVTVTDPLDPATLEWSTVSLETIRFGNTSLSPPPGLANYSTTVDLRPAKNLLVQITASLDPFTHALAWLFRSLDPTTGQPPVNPLVGFLPPNSVPPAGEGSVQFTIRSKSGLPTGAQISNAATITFDDPPSLNTPPWVISVDNTPPASQVLPFAPPQDPARFTVRWSADGPPSDLRDFTIYSAEDAGPYTAWRVNTAAITDTFAARAGHTYRFFSVARDHTGNLEAAPAGPDAQISSTVGVGDVGARRLSLAGPRPNPSRGALDVWLTLGSNTPATLELYDLAGRLVVARAVGTLGLGEHRVTLGTPAALRTGLYFLRLAQDGRVLHARAAVIR